jgi:hypothetical protein
VALSVRPGSSGCVAIEWPTSRTRVASRRLSSWLLEGGQHTPSMWVIGHHMEVPVPSHETVRRY